MRTFLTLVRDKKINLQTEVLTEILKLNFYAFLLHPNTNYSNLYFSRITGLSIINFIDGGWVFSKFKNNILDYMKIFDLNLFIMSTR